MIRPTVHPRRADGRRLQRRRGVKQTAISEPLRPKRVTGYTPLRVAVAALLWVAAAAKAWEIASQPLSSDWWWRLAQVELEWLLGLLLVSGLWQRTVWWLTAGAFTLFAAVSGYQVHLGAHSCGCFGHVIVRPEIMLTVDLTVLALLVIARPSFPVQRQFGRRPLARATALWASVAVVVGVALALLMVVRRPAMIDDAGQIVGDAHTVVLKPNTWAGKPFPLAAHIDSSEALMTGRWAVLLYHADCPRCQELLERWPANWGAESPDDSRAIVVVPPAAGALAELERLNPRPWIGRLASQRDWLVPTPTIVYLSGGRVTGTSRDRASAVESGSSPDDAAHSVPTTPSDELPTRSVGQVHDLGFIEPASEHRFRWIVENPLSEEVSIEDTQIECDCMRLVDPPSRIGAGQSAELWVEMAAGKKPVAYQKRIVLETDKPELRHVILTVRARIGLPLRVEPDVWHWRPVAGALAGQAITLYNDGQHPCRLLYCTSDTPGIIVRVPAEPVAGGGQVELAIEAAADAQPPDGGEAKLRLVTTIPVQRELSLTVRISPE